MECLFCYNLDLDTFGKDLTLSWSTFTKLFDISTSKFSQPLFNLSKLSICFECNRKLASVHRMFVQLDEIQVKLSMVRCELTASLIKSVELSEVKGNQLEERSKIIEEILRSSTNGLGLDAIPFKYEKDPEKCSTPAEILLSNSNDDNDDGIDHQNFPEIIEFEDFQDADTDMNIERISKEVRIILDPLSLPSNESTFNMNDERIENIIRRESNRLKTKINSNFKSLISKPRQKANITKSSPTNQKKGKKRGRPRIADKDKTHNKQKQIIKSQNFKSKYTKSKGSYNTQRNKYCSICNIKFKSPCMFIVHNRQKHTLERPYKCFDPNCTKAFANKDCLNAHLVIHGIGPNCVQCPTCSINVRRTKLDEHIRSHTGVKPFLCEFCCRCFSHIKTLREHRLSQHLDQKFKCTYESCDLQFNTSKSLQYHIEKEHVMKVIPCTEAGCTRTFVTNARLNDHIRKRHSQGEKPTFVCHYCSASISSNANLQIHIKKLHTKELPYICTYPICRKNGTHAAFPTKNGLDRHLKLHSGIKDFMCHVCGPSKAYAVKSSLDTHIRKFHSSQ